MGKRGTKRPGYCGSLRKPAIPSDRWVENGAYRGDRRAAGLNFRNSSAVAQNNLPKGVTFMKDGNVAAKKGNAADRQV
jgi:hypothetical protein